MKINRQSWHYRIQNEMFDYGKNPYYLVPKNTCSYFLKTVMAIAKAIAKAVKQKMCPIIEYED